MLKSMPKAVAGLLCAFEVVAITTGKVPTITSLCDRHPVLAPALILALAVHLARSEPSSRAVVDGECILCPVAF